MGEHEVQLYDDPAGLTAAVARWFSDGLAAEEGALAVARPEHADAFRRELVRLGHDPDELERSGRLVLRDAAETLAEVLGDAPLPAPARFERVVQGLLNLVSARDNGVRVFGEMVDVLWCRGERSAADALEHLWNRLQERRRFALLCAYRVDDLFGVDLHGQLLPLLCGTHGLVRLVGDEERLRSAFDVALAAELGAHDAARVFELAAVSGSGASVAPHQLAVSWLCAHMPRAAERVLAAARAQYAVA